MDRPRLTVEEQQHLADALLDCECIRDRRVRDQVVQTLRHDAVGQHINVARQELDRADVIGILHSCARQAGGLHTLLACVELFETGTMAVERLRSLVAQAEPDPLLSGVQRARLDNLLSVIVCPDAESLYWEAVGQFGPVPTASGDDLIALARDLGDVLAHNGPLPPLIQFLELVAARAGAHRQALHQWIDEYALNGNIDIREITRQRSTYSDRPEAPAESYLVLQLESYGPHPEHYLLSAWFQRGGVSKTLRRDEEPIVVEDLAQIIDLLLTRDAEVTRDATSRLVVELVLPRTLINRDVDQWPIAPENFERPVGTQHPVVVRSFERLHNPALHRDWRRKWEWLKENGHDPGATGAGIHWINRPAEVDPTSLLIQLMAVDVPVCIGMAFAPPVTDSLRDDEFAAAVHAGAPAVLWCRDEEAAQLFAAELKDLLAGQGLLKLPELIHRYRQQAHYPGAPPGHLGRHLALLWDDYDRKPEEPNTLLAPTRGNR